MTPNSAVVAVLLLAVGTLATHALEPPQIEVTPVAKATTTVAGQPLVFPTDKPQVVVSIYTIAPGAMTPRHKHPALRYAYVLEGTLTVELEGGTNHSYPPGSFLVEVLEQWHVGKNAGPTPIRLLVVDHVVEGRSNVVTE